MATSYKELLDERRELETRIAAALDAERPKALATIRELMAQFDITVADITAKATTKKGARKTGAPAPKYRDPDTGATWTGMGRVPHWLVGQDRARFAI
jgi:DNA-binding protein H-NS